MRQIVLDTETTGLDAKNGDRIIEIGCVEILSRSISGAHFHHYLHPEREVEAGATPIHGKTLEDLASKPKFPPSRASSRLRARGRAHITTPPDVEFLDRRSAAGWGRLADHVAKVTDSLASPGLHPGRKTTRRALLRQQRESHPAGRSDARLLGECYLAMTRGQESLMMELEAPAAAAAAAAGLILDVSKLIVQRASPDEQAAHEKYLDALEKDAKGPSVWRRLSAA